MCLAFNLTMGRRVDDHSLARAVAPYLKENAMTRSLTAALRRASRLMQPAGRTKATRSFQKAMTSLIAVSLSPLTDTGSTTAKARKAKAPRTGGGLSAVFKQLRAAQSFLPDGLQVAPRRKVSPRIPAGARYLTRQHRSAKGSRSYKLYLPASQPRKPKGILLMLHGCGQDPDDFAVGTHMNAQAEKHGLAVVYPAQSGTSNMGGCWNWFQPAHQGRGRGEPAILASLVRKLMKEYGLGRDAVFVAGLSAGGAMAAILADVYPDVFAAAGVHSGLARGSASDLVSAMSVMRDGGAAQRQGAGLAVQTDVVRRIVFHGDADATIHRSNALRIVTAAIGGDARPTRTTSRSIAGRGYSKSEYAGADGEVVLELWLVEGAGHAWSGGRAGGSFTDRKGPDASAQMIRFFLANSG